MYFKRLEEHIVLAVFIVIVALGTAVVAGNSLIAAGITIAAGLLILSRINPMGGSGDTQRDHPLHLDGAPFTFTFTWKLAERPDLEIIKSELAAQGLTAESAGRPDSDLVMRGGSHLWTRLFGGFFVALRRLPIRAEVSVDQGSGGLWLLELRVSDRLGIAVRDATRERRFRMAAERIEEPLEKLLGDAGQQSARA